MLHFNNKSEYTHFAQNLNKWIDKAIKEHQEETDKKVSVSQYLKMKYTKKSRDTIIRMLRNGILPENVESCQLIGVTYVLTLKYDNPISQDKIKTLNNGK